MQQFMKAGHLYAFTFIGLVLLSMGALFAGTIPLSPVQLWRADPLASLIIYELRLPRILLALLIGWALGLSGAAIQGLLKNPLAEPMVLGAGNMAALGAVLMIYIGLTAAQSWAVPIAASMGALLSVVLLFLLTRKDTHVTRLILAGFAISALGGAGISLALNLSPNPFAALEIAFWLLGSLENRGFDYLYLVLPLIGSGSALILWRRRDLDRLTLGEETARSLGINIIALRWRIAFGLALSIGGVVAVAGVIGFVGLVVPHLVRQLRGHMPSHSLIMSGLIGAALVLTADSFIRAFPFGGELKLGVVTALIGVPFFLYILLRHKSFTYSV